MVMKTTTNTGKKQKNSAEMQIESGSHLNHNLFSEKCHYDPWDVFSKPTINIRINEFRFQKEPKLQNPNFFDMKTRVIDVIKHIVSR